MFFLDELQQGMKRSAFARLDFNRHNYISAGYDKINLGAFA